MTTKINTKLEAYKLIHDPTRLFSLLFSKYGDIDEDYYLLIINQLVFNKSSHLNVFYKEKKIIDDKGEFMRRFYLNKESLKRIPKLNEYYKNYHIFFCKPTLTDFVMGNVLKNYEDNKAEIFYKNNYKDSNINKDDNDKSEKWESSSLSSLDNITYNKIIFDKKNRELIDNDLDSKNITISLTLESLKANKNNNGPNQNFISEGNSDKENSFIKSIKNIVYYQESKKKKTNIIRNNNIIIKEIVKNKNNINNKKNYNDNNNNIDNKMNNLNNICTKINENIKNKKNSKNEKALFEKQDNINNHKDNKEKNNHSKLLNKLNIHNSLFSLTRKTQIKVNKKNSNNKHMRNNYDNNKNNIFLSPQASKNYFKNITSRISEFNKYKPMNLKNSKRNKSYRLHNNYFYKNQLIKNNPTMVINNSKNYIYYNNQFLDINLKNHSATSKNKNINNNINHKNFSNNNIKSNHPQIIKYNQFLMMNNNNIKKHKNNKTFDLNMIDAQKNVKIFTKSKNFMYNLKKMTQSSNNSPMNIEYNGLVSKFNLFKSGVSSPYHNINNIKGNRHFNNFQSNNKLSMNQTTNFNENKKFLISNSIENNMHLKSLSPKSISNNISINNEKKQELLNKISFNKINNNFKNQNSKNKIKIPVRHNKNSISYSNSNYNINFNNLIFYGPSTPTSFIDDINYNIINNNNQNLNKINANFYMMNINNLYNNSRNKIKFIANNSNSKVKTHTNSQSKKTKISENEKHNSNIKKSGLSFNEKKIPFAVNRQFIGKIKNLGNASIKEKSNKIKMNHLYQHFKNNTNIKKKNNKSFSISDNEKNSENGRDKIDKRKFSLINLRGISGN